MPNKPKTKTFDYRFKQHALSGIDPTIGGTKWFNAPPEMFKDSIDKRQLSFDSDSSHGDAESDIEESSRSETTSKQHLAKRKKKNKKRKTTDTVSEDEDPATIEQWPNYVKIVCEKAPVSAAQARTRSKAKAKATAEHIMDRGVFFSNTVTTFDEYLTLLAKNVPCKLESLVVPQLYWRFEKPMNTPRKPLNDATSYKAMIMSVEERRKDRVIEIYMPKPKVDVNIVPWDTGEDEQIPYVDFEDNDMMMEASEDTSIAAKKASLLKDSGEYLEQLCEKYPIDPVTGLRIYTDLQTGHRWELTEIRLQVWSANMAKGPEHATLHKPPTSVHFSHKARMQTVVKDSAPPVSVQTTTVATPTPTSSMSNLAELLTLALTNQILQQPFNSRSLMPAPPALPLPSAPAPAETVTTQGKEPETLELPRNITLEEFSERYGISRADLTKLEKLEVELSDPRCLELDKEVWKGDGGFSELGWMRFKDKYARFRSDIINGLWN